MCLNFFKRLPLSMRFLPVCSLSAERNFNDAVVVGGQLDTGKGVGLIGCCWGLGTLTKAWL